MPALLSSRTYLRLWAIGGCVNTMRSFEVLCAALFTLDVTGSGLAVAVVSAARTLPMLLLGAFAGVMSEAVNRKHILLAGQVMSAIVSATIAVLAAFGVVQPWHVGLAALLAGTVWSTEMSTRRRMVGESVAGRPGPARAGVRYGDQFHHAADRTDCGRCCLPGIGSRRCLRDIGRRLSDRGHPGRGIGVPAGQPQDRAVRCAARPRRGVRVRPRPRDHRRCARGYDRDEPAGVLLLRAGRADRAAGVHGIADADRHAGRRRGVRRIARWLVADRRRAPAERTHADGGRVAAVPGVRDPDAVRTDASRWPACCWSSAGSVRQRSPTCRRR